ncbi:hypothetical protein [Microcystis phage Mwe-JY26]
MLSDDFIKGAWFAFDEVLSWINTQDKQFIDKSDLYKHVMQLRPSALLRQSRTEP